MKRDWMLVLLLALFAAAPLAGCRAEVDADDDDAELDVKVDDEGRRRGVTIDAD